MGANRKFKRKRGKVHRLPRKKKPYRSFMDMVDAVPDAKDGDTIMVPDGTLLEAPGGAIRIRHDGYESVGEDDDGR